MKRKKKRSYKKNPLSLSPNMIALYAVAAVLVYGGYKVLSSGVLSFAPVSPTSPSTASTTSSSSDGETRTGIAV